MQEMKCVPSCTYNKYVAREIFDANFDPLVYRYGPDADDGANFDVLIFIILLFDWKSDLIQVKICFDYYCYFSNPLCLPFLM